jgi:hypothetical protein
MSQREVAIVGHNNTKVKITGQQEILTKSSMIGSSTVVLNDVNTITGEFESIVVLEDTVFNSIKVNNQEVLTNLVTTPALPVRAGAILSWGQGQYFNSLKLSSGSVLLVRR